jgi:site-specific DNA-cytosine methylase
MVVLLAAAWQGYSKCCVHDGNDCLLMQESNLFFKALEKVQEYARITGHLPTLISENVQGRRFRRWDESQVRCGWARGERTCATSGFVVLQQRWTQPFLKVEADALLAAGYDDVGWRQVTSEAFGVPNPKAHINLIATAGPTTVVDSCLFSTVRLTTLRVCGCVKLFAVQLLSL